MSVLSAQSIRRLAAMEDMIDPFNEGDRDPWGHSFGLSAATYDFRIAEDVRIHPRAFVLASTIEVVKLPIWVCATILDKSTWARRGLSLFNTFIDPGFRGHVTLEMVNTSQFTLDIKAGAGIGQFMFMRLDWATQKPYAGKYQDQGAGPQKAI